MSAPQTNSHEGHRAGFAAYMDEPLFDALSSLIRQVYSTSGENQVRSVILTATDKCSGVSYLSSCMATLIAEEFGATILVDGPLIERLAQKGRIPRRSDCKQINNSHLWVLSATEASGMACSEKSRSIPVGAVIEALIREFEYIVIDAPALSVADTAESLSPYVDGSILVAMPNRTEIQDLAEARTRLTARGGHILGAIYNTSSGQSGAGGIE